MFCIVGYIDHWISTIFYYNFFRGYYVLSGTFIRPIIITIIIIIKIYCLYNLPS